MQPDDALKMISLDRLKRIILQVNNGVYSLAKNIDEEALAKRGDRARVQTFVPLQKAPSKQSADGSPASKFRRLQSNFRRINHR